MWVEATAIHIVNFVLIYTVNHNTEDNKNLGKITSKTYKSATQVKTNRRRQQNKLH